MTFLIDLRDKVRQPVMAQGARPLCVPFSLSVLHEALRRTGDEEFEALAPEPIWSHAYRAGATTEFGMSLEAAHDGISTDGQCALSEWPYNDTLGYGTEDAPDGCVPPWNLATLEDIPVANDGIEQAIVDVLVGGSPVLVGVALTHDFYFPDDGVVADKVGGSPDGLHAVAAVGVVEDPKVGRSLLVKNSWDVGWGKGGFAILAPSFTFSHLRRAARLRPA